MEGHIYIIGETVDEKMITYSWWCVGCRSNYEFVIFFRPSLDKSRGFDLERPDGGAKCNLTTGGILVIKWDCITGCVTMKVINPDL